MALTRKMLKAMGIEEEKIDQIIEAHTETVDALKEQRDSYKGDADKLAEVQKELGKTKKELETAAKDEYKEKYETLKAEFDTFKNEQTEKETRQAKENAYREILKAAGVSEKRIDTVLKVSDIDGLELVDGKLKDSEKLSETIKTEWADFIPITTQTGGKAANPPATTANGKDPGEMSMSEYIAYRKGV